MSLPDNNLRKLSTAYSRGLIDSNTYRRLRTAQLSALEFDRKLPDLPAEMLDITIPKQKVDEPHQPKFNKSSSKGLVWFVIAALIATGAVYYYIKLKSLM